MRTGSMPQIWNCSCAAGWKRSFSKKRHQFALYVEKMKGLSPLEKLNQGYAYVEDKKGRPVRQIADVKEGDAIRIYVSDRMIEAQVKGMTEEIQYHA